MESSLDLEKKGNEMLEEIEKGSHGIRKERSLESDRNYEAIDSLHINKYKLKPVRSSAVYQKFLRPEK